jgi:hypothetical protein
VPHQNSVFHAVMNHVPWSVFETLVTKHGTDARVRRLRSKDHLIALLFGQLAGARSIREITGAMQSHAARLYHLGTRPIARSTLADANTNRSYQVFADLFAVMVEQGGRKTRRAIGEAVHLVDSTTVSLSNLSADWARFSAKACGAKLHLVLDPNADQPTYADITPSNINDITAAKSMPITPGMTYVFDLGYYDYAWWAKLDAAGCHIVTRLKSNTKLIDIHELPVPPGGAILSDRIGHLPVRLAKNRCNPFQDPIREVRVQLETGVILRIMSNDLDAQAQDIADLYKRRWAIELFFRWVKQTLRIAHFLGASENAVRIQIIVALIAHMLLRMAQATQTVIASPLAFARLVRTNLMHRRGLGELTASPIPLPNKNQLVLL